MSGLIEGIRPEELIVDNFAGGGGASQGIEQALGRPIDIAINHDAEAIAMHAANHPNTRHLCENVWSVDIEKETSGRPVGLAWFSPDCFVPGTLVITRRGLIPIEDVIVGEEVLTHKNRWRPVVSTHTHEAPETVEVRGYGHYGLITTPTHGFYSKRITTRYPNARKPNGARTGPKRSLAENPYWPEAHEMDGKLWATPHNVPPTPMPIPEDIQLSDDFFYFLGRWMGDGSITRLKTEKKHVRGMDPVTTGDIDIACGQDELQSMREHFDAHPLRDGEGRIVPYRVRETDTARHLVWGKQGLSDWLALNIGFSCETKQLPLWCLSLHEAWRSSILDGYVSADGHEGARTETISVSKKLSIGVRLLVVSLGPAAALYYTPAKQYVIEGRTVQGLPAYRVGWRPDSQRITTISDGRHTFYPVREICSSGRRLVVSLQVEEDESFVADGIVVHNCCHFSKAKGGKPVKKNIRGLAWVALRWAGIKKPRVIILENVEEFRDWGPVVDGQPCKRRKGMTFKRWCTQFRNLGYTVDWRELRACDYGAPTIRKRLFVVARLDVTKIPWPEKTHGKDLIPYRTAAECIDWSIPCPSIFLTRKEARKIGANRPLVENTMRRIARGVKRYVLDSSHPFIVSLTHQGSDRVEDIDDPMRTITGAHRGEKAVVVPILSRAERYASFVVNMAHGGKVESLNKPISTIATEKGGCRAIVVPTLITTGYGEREGQAPRVPGVEKPLGTVVAGGVKHAVVSTFLSTYYGEKTHEDVRGSRTDEPVDTIPTENRHALVAAFLAQYNGGPNNENMSGRPADQPISTLTSACSQQNIVTATFVSRQFGKSTGSATDKPVGTVTAAGGGKSALVASHLVKLRGTCKDGQRVDRPAPTISAQGKHIAEVRAFLFKYFGTPQDPNLDDPIHTVTSKHRFGLVMVLGELYEIVDIGMRMLTPRELFNAQGFPPDYIIDGGRDVSSTQGFLLPGAEWVELTTTSQVRMCGNSVCPPAAEAVVRAQFGLLEKSKVAA